jgi:hypothetical protein
MQKSSCKSHVTRFDRIPTKVGSPVGNSRRCGFHCEVRHRTAWIRRDLPEKSLTFRTSLPPFRVTWSGFAWLRSTTLTKFPIQVLQWILESGVPFASSKQFRPTYAAEMSFNVNFVLRDVVDWEWRHQLIRWDNFLFVVKNNEPFRSYYEFCGWLGQPVGKYLGKVGGEWSQRRKTENSIYQNAHSYTKPRC